MFILAFITLIAATMIPNLSTGIRQHFDCGVNQSNDGYKTGLQVLGIVLKCSWDKFIDFWNGKCTIYYICSMIWGILYGLFIEFPIFLIFLITGIDLQFLVTLVFDVTILPIDTIIYSIFGLHIIEWPESVLYKCYRCNGTVGGKEFSKTLDWWVSIFTCTNKEIALGVDHIFTSIIPGPHWNAWFNGRHLPASDWST